MRKHLCFLFTLITIAFSGNTYAQEADTALMVRLKEVEVIDARKWTNDTARYRFNQMKYYVTTVLPYVEIATKSINELEEKINRKDISKGEKRAFVRSKEGQLKTQFEERIKSLNETQGVLLIKLIARQSGANIYSVLSDFKNPFTAIKWQAWARINGFNINRQYNPADEPLLEQVMLSLGYELPAFYNGEETATAMQRP